MKSWAGFWIGCGLMTLAGSVGVLGWALWEQSDRYRFEYQPKESAVRLIRFDRQTGEVRLWVVGEQDGKQERVVIVVDFEEAVQVWPQSLESEAARP